MLPPPAPHPLHMGTAAEVIFVLLPARPPPLALGLRRLPAVRLPAVALPAPVARITDMHFSAIQTLESMLLGHGRFRSNQWFSPPASPLEKNPPTRRGSKSRQQNPGRRVLFGKSWKKIQHNQNPIFKPAISSGFQIAGHICRSATLSAVPRSSTRHRKPDKSGVPTGHTPRRCPNKNGSCGKFVFHHGTREKVLFGIARSALGLRQSSAALEEKPIILKTEMNHGVHGV